MLNTKNKFTGFEPKIGMLHIYDPRRGDLCRADQDNTPPELAAVLPIAYTEFEGHTMIVFEWIHLDLDGNVTLEVDYGVVECLYPATDYLPVRHRQPMGKTEIAMYNTELMKKAAAQKQMDEERLPRSASAILMDGVGLLDERGQGYDHGQERSAARVAAMFSAMKNREFSAMDVWDLLICLKLVRAQDTTSIDSRVDLTNYGALSAEEMENIIYGSGPSEVEAEEAAKISGIEEMITGFMKMPLGVVIKSGINPKREF